jgi:hypothetical protein
MANHSNLAQRDRDLDDGLLDLPAQDRQALRKLDNQGAAPTTKPPVPKRKPARKAARTRRAKTPPPSYSNETPKGLWPVGTTVKYLGGSKLKNQWLKKGAVGRVFGYRPGRKGGGLYAVRFKGHATLLSTQRVAKAANGTGS